ncbi:MAG TPA: PEP-CTERM sorting domain-containing protein [Armatimonadota bacterium]|jgi:hypothetical protein
MIRTITGCVLGVMIIAASPARANSVFDTGGFEAYALGPVAGQSNWQNDSSASQPAPTIYEDAFTEQEYAPGKRHNKVLKIDPTGLTTGDFSGAYLPFGEDIYAAGLHQIPIEFDQFRGTLSQEVYVLEAAGSLFDSSYLADEYGLETTPNLHPTGDVSDRGIPLTAGSWQHVKLLIDMDAQQVFASVDGLPPTTNPQHFDLGVPPVKQFRGIGFRVYGTNRGTPNGPNYFDNVVVGNTAVPEPSTLALLAAALGPLGFIRRRHRV